MSVRATAARTGILALVVGLVAAAFQVVPWYRDVGLVEEWGVYLHFDALGVVLWAPSDPGLAVQAIRPFTVLPHSIAYALGPDSFVSLQGVQALGIGVKAGAMVLLLAALGMRRSIVVTGGVLYGLFPAHDASFTLRAVHLHWSSAFFVLALWLLVVQIARRRSWPLTVCMMLALLMCLLLYEAPYGLVAIAPLLLLAYPGPTNRARLQLAALWYAVPFVNGLRILELMHSDRPLYQETIIVRANRGSNEILDLVERIWRGTYSPLVSPHGHALALLPVVAAVALAAVVLVQRRLDDRPDEQGASRWRYGAVALASLAVAPLTALVYLPQPGHLVDPLRVFSVAALPLTIGVCAALTVAARYWTHAGAVAAVVLVPLVLTAAQADRGYWHQRSDEQRQVLGAISTAASRAPTSDRLLVVDADGILGRDAYALQGPLLGTAVLYLRETPDGAVVNCGALDRPPVRGVASACVPVPPDGFSVDGAPAAPYPVIITLRRPGSAPAGPPADPARLTRRERELLPCIADNTCATGPYGVEATAAAG